METVDTDGNRMDFARGTKKPAVDTMETEQNRSVSMVGVRCIRWNHFG